MVHPRCVHVIDELSTYSYEIDKKTEEVLPILADKKNHTIDALRYAIEKERRMMSGWGVFEYTRRLAEARGDPAAVGDEDPVRTCARCRRSCAAAA